MSPRRSSSPIRKPSRASAFFRNFARAATYPCIAYPFPISPDSCFTDDIALEQLLSHSLPDRPSTPPLSHPISIPLSPVTSDVTQFPFLLPDSTQPLNIETMSISEHNPDRHNNNNTNDSNNNSNSNNNHSRTSNRHSSTNATTPRTINRRRRSPHAINNESTTRRRTSTPNASLRCDICHQYYSRRDNLRAHQRVHTGDRPYQCRFCAQRFRWLGALRNHETIHERDGDRPLNPPPPGARQPTASSARQTTASSSRQTATSSRSPDRNRSRSHHASSSGTQPAEQSTAPHRTQRTSPTQRRSHPHVPNLELDLDPTHGTNNRPLFTEGEPQVSPLYTGSHESWDNILDDIPEDHS